MRMILSKIQTGQVARIIRVLEQSPEIQRLQELGFVEGSKIRLVRKGLMGSPLLFEICDTQIAVRLEESALFEVE